MKTITRFIYSEVTTICDNETDRIITVDEFNNTISANRAHGDIFPVIKLSKNNTHVIKFNKTSISICNVEMFANAISNNDELFDAVYTYVTLNEIVTYHKCDCSAFANKFNMTISAFYNSFNDNLDAWLEFFESCSHETRRTIIADHICYSHEAKMEGIISLSTYVGHNKYCIARCNNCDNAICKYCYANSLTNQRYYLKTRLIRVHAIFTNIALDALDIPAIDASVYQYFRFESFGDLNNTLQFDNYNLFCKCNSRVSFTLWTKNPGIIQRAINNGTVLADNLVIGLSSLYLNKPEIDKAKKYSFVRFLFTVYDDNYIKEHNIFINCGAKHCITCGICYKYLHEHRDGLFIINERKK